jgi:hypothetical protein
MKGFMQAEPMRPRTLKYWTENGKGCATFGPEFRDYILTTTDKSFPVLDDAGNVLYEFKITEGLLEECSRSQASDRYPTAFANPQHLFESRSDREQTISQ